MLNIEAPDRSTGKRSLKYRSSFQSPFGSRQGASSSNLRLDFGLALIGQTTAANYVQRDKSIMKHKT